MKQDPPLPAHRLRYDALLLLTATIWGFAFVAQRVGMEHVGPFTFNGIRFGLGALVLIPWIARRRSSPGAVPAPLGGPWSRGLPHGESPLAPWQRSLLHGELLRNPLLQGSLSAGLILFVGASLQQAGLVYTTAGKAGFITGLYVVLVPVLGYLFWRQTSALSAWLGALAAVAGLYLLSMRESLTIDRGDALVCAGAFAWALHVLVIGRFAHRVDPLRLAALQFAICSLLSLVAAVLCETITLAGIRAAAAPILYGGLVSVGIAYTLQVVAQRRAHPAPAAIIMSLEAVFAAVGGAWLLGETLSSRELAGCALMLAGVVVSQWKRPAPTIAAGGPPRGRNHGTQAG